MRGNGDCVLGMSSCSAGAELSSSYRVVPFSG